MVSDVSVTGTECICNGLIFLHMKEMPHDVLGLIFKLALSGFEFLGFFLLCLGEDANQSRYVGQMLS